jgi:hypothetical protein
LSFNLTPCIPLSFRGEGEINIKEGLTPLLNSSTFIICVCLCLFALSHDPQEVEKLIGRVETE